MKFEPDFNPRGAYQVALYTSAWIEILWPTSCLRSFGVALYTSAWIEIDPDNAEMKSLASRTLHECVD